MGSFLWFVIFVFVHPGVIVKGEEIDILAVRQDFVDSDPELLIASAAEFGKSLARITVDGSTTTSLRLLNGVIDQDCSVTVAQTREKVKQNYALLLDRGGGCTFAEKVLNAQAAGASLVVIRDTILGAFESIQSSSATIYDCTKGSSSVASNKTFPMVENANEALNCTASESCTSNTCVLTGKVENRKQYQVCCFKKSIVKMRAEAQQQYITSKIFIPSLFITLHDGEYLKNLLQSRLVFVEAFNAEENPWNISMFLTWIVGVFVVMGASYYSSRDERANSYKMVVRSYNERHDRMLSRSNYVSIDDDSQEEEEERMQLSQHHALLFLISASGMLILIYYVHLTLVLNVLFAVAAAAASAKLVFQPGLSSVLNDGRIENTWVIWLSAFFATSISLFWFFERMSSKIWPLQDFLCICLCFILIDSIRLPSLRVAASLFTVAFIYDVFFVYLSPLIFGSNVMIDVASGSGNVRLRDSNYCEYHPKASECKHVSLPMVLSIPLIFSVYGGNALLGLGDIVIPGLLVSFCLRYDYCQGYPISRNYFCVASVSYSVGLLLANIMAITLRDIVAGQPALMYIVPSMLLSVLGVSICKGEYRDMWEGPECFNDDQIHICDLPESETEPFLRK